LVSNTPQLVEQYRKFTTCKEKGPCQPTGVMPRMRVDRVG
jgi:hypothetical protein